MWIYDDIWWYNLYRWRFVTEVNLHPLTWIQPVQCAGARGVSSIAGSDSRSVTALPHNRVGEGGIDGYVGRWSAVICWSYRFFFFVTPFFPGQLKTFHMGMDQYLLIPCLGGWTSIYQLFWCELQGYKVLTHCHINPEKIQQTSCHLVGSLVQVTTSPVLAPAWPAWERQSSPSSSHVRSCVEAWSRSSFFRDKYDQHWRTLMSAIQMITDDNWP